MLILKQLQEGNATKEELAQIAERLGIQLQAGLAAADKTIADTREEAKAMVVMLSNALEGALKQALTEQAAAIKQSAEATVEAISKMEKPTIHVDPPSVTVDGKSFPDFEIKNNQIRFKLGEKWSEWLSFAPTVSLGVQNPMPIVDSVAHTRDIGNEQVAALEANETFTGTFRRVDTYGSIQILYAALTPLTSVQVQWSNDGVNILPGLFGSSTLTQRIVSGYNVVYQVYSGSLMAPYYRLHVVNGATPQTTFPGFISLVWLNKDQYNGVFDFLDANLTQLSKGLLVRSILATYNPLTQQATNLSSSSSGALHVEDEDTDVTHSGSLFVEGIRDDIQLNFATQDPNDGTILVNTSTGGTAVPTGGGQVEFATPAVAGNTCIFRSAKNAVYEPGHSIRGDQTIEVVTPPTGDATVFWGYSNGNEAIGFLLRSTGLSCIRKTGGVIVNEVAQTAWNRDKCNGVAPSGFFYGGTRQTLNTLKNNFYAVKFAWLGADGPEYWIKPPSNNPPLLSVHQEEFSNNNTGPTISTPILPLAIEINNGTSAAAIKIRCGSWRGGIHTSEVQIPGLPNWKTLQVTVGTSPVKLDNTGKLQTRTSCEVLSYATNTNNQRVFVGPDNTVTISGGANPGRPIENGESFRMDLSAAGTIWAVASTAGMVVQFSQIGT